jgi:hypothetical protein
MKKVLIIEDNSRHNELIKEGVLLCKAKCEVVNIDLDQIISFVKDKRKEDLIQIIPNDIDLFIIDVSLEKGQDELGLEFLLLLNDGNYNIKNYIITSIWEWTEFVTKVTINEKYIINKNDYVGFELKIKIRNICNKLLK